MKITLWRSIVLASGLLVNAAYAAQHALVVGVNEYRHDGARLKDNTFFRNLEGAANDARIIAAALRANGVLLPDKRVLINQQATREAFMNAWQDLLTAAEPGDTLILTYAGHGGREADRSPMDELDQYDETLQLHEYNPIDPTPGSLSDDDLHELFKSAADFNIVFVADTCFSGGLTRNLQPPGRSRFGGIKFEVDKPKLTELLDNSGDDNNDLPHVTIISASNSDSLDIKETMFDEKPHGALSWYFAQALQGAADRDGDRRLSRSELLDYLTKQIHDKMERLQTPLLRPRGDPQPVLDLAGVTSTPEPEVKVPTTVVTIKVQGGEPPATLSGIRQSEKGYALRFVINGNSVTVFNELGDQLSVIENKPNAWRQIIERERLLTTLSTLYTPKLHPIQFDLQVLDRNHKPRVNQGVFVDGDQLIFTVRPQGDIKLPALTLFNIAGDGEFQPLYPLSRYKDPTLVERYPFPLPKFKVTTPYGADVLVAILCQTEPEVLHVLMNSAGEPTADTLAGMLELHHCQVGHYALFTQESNEKAN